MRQWRKEGAREVGSMRGEEEGGRGGSLVRPLRTWSAFTVGYPDARMDMHAMGYHQLKPARLGCMDIGGRWWVCAVCDE